MKIKLHLLFILSIFFSSKEDDLKVYCQEGEICETAVFPNPTDSFANISFSSNVVDSSSVSVFNLNDQALLEKRIKISNGFNKQILNLEGLESGIHIIAIKLDDQVAMRVIKE
jgi:hypothetical protein